MPHTSASKRFMTEPDRAVVQVWAVFPIHGTSLPDRTVDALQGIRWIVSVALSKPGSFDGVPRTE